MVSIFLFCDFNVPNKIANDSVINYVTVYIDNIICKFVTTIIICINVDMIYIFYTSHIVVRLLF